MFVARDQENVVHARQQAAVSKPLNQGVRQLQPKTPGNKLPKTPFKGVGNDENNLAPFGGGKQGLTVRRNQNGDNGKLGGPVDKRPLATPLGPQNRAPLGLKTTNAKTNIFQTPAPPLGTIKQGRTGRKSTTTRKNKKQTQPSQPIQKTQQRLEVEEDVPDIEYMPPKPKPLPDHDDYITYNTSFPQFKGRNFARGWDRIYENNEIGKDGLTRKERETRKNNEAYDKRIDDLIKEQIDRVDLLEIDGPESPKKPCTAQSAREERKKKAQPRTTVTRSMSNLRARSAARALSTQPKPAAPARPKVRTSTRAGLTAALTSRKKAPIPSNPSSMRHTAAVANSRSTVGYSRGRRVSSTLKTQPAGGRKETQRPSTRKTTTKPSILSPEKYVELYGLPPVGSEMWSKCNAAGFFDPDFSEPLEEVPLDYEEDEEAANFQLTL